MKKLIPLVLIAGAVILGFGWWKTQLSPVNPSQTTSVAFVIAPAQPGSEILTNLAQNKLIRSVVAAKIYLKVLGLDKKIQPGTFAVSPSLTTPEVFQRLTRGPQDIRVTIPEGWRREQIALRMQNELGPTNFDISDFMRSTTGLEGQLFPDTYLLPQSASASDVIRIMTGNFNAKTTLSPATQADELIMASLVEREGNSDADRPVIAAILKKRLAAGWPLQIDATIQYAMASAKCATTITTCEDWWPEVTDTSFPSIYNTYAHVGLPPAPIANPGLASIQAVLEAGETQYWYYLHAPDGQVYFGRTIEEHNLNVDKYLKH